MSEPVATPAASVPREGGSVATNISKGIQDRAGGKAPAAPAQSPINNGAQQPPANPAAGDPNAGKEKYVVDGKEVWITPAQRTALIQKGIAFEPKVDLLNRLQQETGEFLKTLSADPLKILTDKRIGMTPEAVFDKIMASGQISDALKEKVGKWYYKNVVQPLQMTPEQREALENRKKLTDYEAREAKARDMAIEQENRRRADIAGKQLLGFVREAMLDSGLPDINTPLGNLMARRTLELSQVASKTGQAITPKQAIEKVKAQMKEFNAMWLDHLDEENLVKELGESNAEKVKKYFLKLVKDANKTPPVVPKGRAPVNGERKTISPDEMHDYLEGIKKNNRL